MAGLGKRLTDEQIIELMNQTGVTSVQDNDDSECVDDVEAFSYIDSEVEDNLEIEELYDSDEDVEYFPLLEPESDESDEYDEGDGAPKKKKRKIYTSTPIKCRTPAVAAAPATTSASTSAAAATATTSAAAPATTSAAAAPVRRGRRRQDAELPPVVDFNKTSISSRSKFRWSCQPQYGHTHRRLSRNILARIIPGPAQEARDVIAPEETFKLFITDSIVQECVTWTNKRIEFTAPWMQTQSKKATYGPTEAKKILALLGVLIAAGQQRDNHLSVLEMWSVMTGCPLYRAAMSKGRFEFLICCLRFDNPETRVERKNQDKFAPIRKVFDEFIDNCTRLYVPRENLTVDEQLLGFRGRCPFRMYIPNKPAKYGIKLVLICDSSTRYMLGGIPYLGKQGTKQPRSGINLGHYYTKELTRPYHGSNRNVTTDNWFTSVPLIADLMNNCRMTLVGTVRANKTEIPHEMKATKTRLHGSSAFLFTKEMTLVSYVAETSLAKKKLVMLMSSQHTQPNIAPSGKPEIIEFYNSTKEGVDTFDQMCATSSCSRKTRRWPLCVWYGILNAAIINAFIISAENRARTGIKIPQRRTFMMNMARALITPWAQIRLSSPVLSRQLRTLITTVCDLPSAGMAAGSPGTSFSDSNSPLVRCADCPSKSDRKTRHRCNKCALPKCPRHVYPICGDCL
ncbi:PiggyBac transposable element-derived protein 4-like 3 [Homarus americanus]|uniref:PiggyBac transposable element-derived protein 4-like 3 n=2 Tax=Homarus americanus TaxID=6706 RepID=A0A8J5TMY6_HOMAM|nr:PiggyBac transposable element-derived protein 4-like 3 [Homarus americanus]